LPEHLMPRDLRSAFAATLVILTSALLLSLHWSQPGEKSSGDVLAAEGGLKWYRGNLHTHSLWSDGDDYLEMIALWYKERGYDFLCFTDHNVLPHNKERWITVDNGDGIGDKAIGKLKAKYSEQGV